MVTHLSVSLAPHGHQGLTIVSIEEIFYMRYDRYIKRVVIRVADRNFYLTGPLAFWVDAINNSGYTFEFINRRTAVNIKYATGIDTRKCLIHICLGDINQWVEMSWTLCQEIAKKYPIIPDRK
ncbi:hypothetical protein GQA12_23995 [Paenibacillus alvei]|nr:hypothetical protein [Paenibacillus alvei]